MSKDVDWLREGRIRHLAPEMLELLRRLHTSHTQGWNALGLRREVAALLARIDGEVKR